MLCETPCTSSMRSSSILYSKESFFLPFRSRPKDQPQERQLQQAREEKVTCLLYAGKHCLVTHPHLETIIMRQYVHHIFSPMGWSEGQHHETPGTGHLPHRCVEISLRVRVLQLLLFFRCGKPQGKRRVWDVAQGTLTT